MSGWARQKYKKTPITYQHQWHMADSFDVIDQSLNLPFDKLILLPFPIA